MVEGHEYRFKLRAKNFYTHYYSIGHLSPWGADSTFFSSDLPQTVKELTFRDRTKTDATIEWTLHTSDADKGYSTIDVLYLLWVDNCQGGPITNLLVNSTTLTEHTISNIPPGSVCRFRMNTLNIIGYSLVHTPTLQVLFAAIPAPPDAPTYFDRSGGSDVTGLEPYITIRWDEPLNKGGVAILGYMVSVSKDGAAFSMQYDGSVEPDIRQFKF
jgi:hypothetical protein